MATRTDILADESRHRICAVENAERRIARNTLLLVAKQAVSIFAEALALGLVMRALGAEGYGVYTAAFGVMGVVFLLSGTLNEVFCRFLSFEFGKGERGDAPAAFASVALLAVFFVAVALLLGETAGLWFVRTRLLVPDGFSVSSVRAYHALLLSTSVGILSLPFSAYVMATERMGFVARMGFLSSGLSVGVALVLHGFAQESRLIAFAGLEIACVAIVLAAYAVKCRGILLDAIRARGVMGRLRSTAAYFLWSSFRSAANAVRFQGTQLYGNAHCGIAFNSAWGAAMKAGGWLIAPAMCFRDAYTPRIVKLRAEGDERRFCALVVRCCALSALVFLVFAGPVFAFAPQLGAAWLGPAMPTEFVPFVRWTLVYYLFDALHTPLHVAIAADERITGYQVTVSLIMAAGLGFAVLALFRGFPPSSAVAGVAFGNFLSFLYRAVYLRVMIRRRTWHS